MFFFFFVLDLMLKGMLLQEAMVCQVSHLKTCNAVVGVKILSLPEKAD